MTEFPITQPVAAPPPAFPRRRLRWVVPPLAAAVLLGAFGLAPTLADTAAPPTLPAISTHDLVAKALGAKSVPGFTGTIQTQTDLGLPDLGSIGPQSSNLLTTLLAPHTISVWYASGGKVRLAIPDSLAETDVISDGTQLWVWQSASQTVSHAAATPDPGTGTSVMPDSPTDLTPSALADRILASADPTTRVFVRGTASVAGRSAYELVLAPTADDTLVADAVIDIDAATGLPLRVQVLARDSGTPVIDVGFSKLTLTVPAASNFTFTAPPGSTTQQIANPSQLLFGDGGGPGGPGGPLVKRQKIQAGDVPPPGRVAPGKAIHVKPGQLPPDQLPPDQLPPASTDTRDQVIGSGWDAVAVVPNAPFGLGQLGTAVSGAWGSGRLLTTKLVSALILPDGRMLVGMVTAARLEAAVGQIGTGS